MGISYEIDHERRLVLARAFGTLTPQEMFAYQREAWSRPGIAGYNELVDMTGVERIEEPSAERMRELVRLSSEMDAPSASKFAIVAPRDLEFGLGRMYEAYRGFNPRSTKQVNVFRTTEAALEWLSSTAPAEQSEPRPSS